MANSSLQGHTWDLPQELCNHLKRIHRAYKGDKNVEGYGRLDNLIKNPKMSYEQLKRIKNFFDTHQTSNTDYMDDKKQDTQFILNGGSKMRYWVDKTLEEARAGVKNPKELKKDVGMMNQFQKDRLSHTKGLSKNPTKVDGNKELKEQKQINKDIYIKKEMALMESLINIFDKNKEICQHKQSLQS